MSYEHDALRSAIRGLTSGCTARNGHDPALWTRLCKEIGVAGLAVPPQYGGAGATILESLVALEELSRNLLPTPMLNTLLATQALLAAGDPEACARLLPPICAGDVIVSITADGTLIDAAGADLLLVIADDELFEVEPAAVVQHPLPSLDLTRRLTTIAPTSPPAAAAARATAAPASAPAAAPLGARINDISDLLDKGNEVAGNKVAGNEAGGDAERGAVSGKRVGVVSGGWVRDLGCVALSAEQVGAASRALELTVAYAKSRVQFGRPIGGFQVLQHRMAEGHVRVEAARSACWTAAEAFAAGSAEASRLAAVAKVWCSETLRVVAADMVQIHGGIAITWEHDAHLYLRRAWDSAQLFGSPRSHLDRLAAALVGGDG
ncbi:acyl-CoA dehydrogenase family protein [Actinoplanes sp. NPDC023714]|uniref:acyl-CoA dehydrogenase family protein n=1 Tax=Actinoplanes sp. NPDC023714 TaxID=3154322 RepID=UPI0033C8E1EB